MQTPQQWLETVLIDCKKPDVALVVTGGRASGKSVFARTVCTLIEPEQSRWLSHGEHHPSSMQFAQKVYRHRLVVMDDGFNEYRYLRPFIENTETLVEPLASEPFTIAFNTAFMILTDDYMRGMEPNDRRFIICPVIEAFAHLSRVMDKMQLYNNGVK